MKRRLPFTVLELVLVITISAILLAISLPAFYNISSGRRLTGALTAIAANVSLARAEAVSNNIYTAIIFNPDGDAMRLAEVNKGAKNNGDVTVFFKRWLDGSSWEAIEDGVVIPSGTENFYEGTSSTAPYAISFVNFSDIGGGDSVSATRAIIVSPRGQIVTNGSSSVTPIVIRVAEGSKPPGAAAYVLKKTGEKKDDKDTAVYGILTVNPLSCRTEVSYVTDEIP